MAQPRLPSVGYRERERIPMKRGQGNHALFQTKVSEKEEAEDFRPRLQAKQRFAELASAYLPGPLPAKYCGR